ncbi:MAG: MoaD/ThiS family protein [Deltaproteobacteria bacterium]|nr:MoaD/ThiS family protein [Deltaproteobacteria bacterium]
MKIHVKFMGLGTLYKAMNKKKDLDLDFPKNHVTVKDIIDSLIQRYGVHIKKALLNQEGDIDMEIRVLHNNKTFLTYGQRMDIALNEGDTLQFMSVG